MGRGRKKRKRLYDEHGNEIRICRRCNQSHKIEEFKKNPSWCQSCVQDYQKAYRESQSQKPSLDAKAKIRAKAAVVRSDNQGIECMTEEELEKEIKRMFFLQGGACLYSGIPMKLESDDKKYSISVDRYRSSCVSKKGPYLTHNLVLTCSIINRMKQELPYSEFLSLCRKVVNHYETLKEEHGIDLCDF